MTLEAEDIVVGTWVMLIHEVPVSGGPSKGSLGSYPAGLIGQIAGERSAPLSLPEKELIGVDFGPPVGTIWVPAHSLVLAREPSTPLEVPPCRLTGFVYATRDSLAPGVWAKATDGQVYRLSRVEVDGDPITVDIHGRISPPRSETTRRQSRRQEPSPGLTALVRKIAQRRGQSEQNQRETLELFDLFLSLSPERLRQIGVALAAAERIVKG